MLRYRSVSRQSTSRNTPVPTRTGVTARDYLVSRLGRTRSGGSCSES